MDTSVGREVPATHLAQFMTAPAHNAPPERIDEPWLRMSIVNTLVGALLGLLTAAILVIASLVVFPGLAAFDHDLGLRMHMFAEQHLAHWSQGIEPGPNWPLSFVFLDIDPEPGPHMPRGSPASPACAALAQTYTRCAALQPGQAAEPNAVACLALHRELNCSAARPLNRYLLAELIGGLRKAGARLIVLDVELGDEAGVVPASENEVLRQVLSESKTGDAPVVFVWPADYDSENEATGVHDVRLGPAYLTHEADSGGSAHARTKRASAIAAVALPAPGQPVRRYAKCFRSTDPSISPLPSLPYIAASLLIEPPVDTQSLCVRRNGEAAHGDDDVYAAPYINYALPALRAHQDDPLDEDDFRVWSTYRQVYNRCLATNFWSAQSLCGSARAYRDKVVVIGASSRLRRDRHATPVGDMAGAEVVINAINSFVVMPHPHETRVPEAIGKKARIVLACLVPWFAFFCLREFLMQHSRQEPPSWPRRLLFGAIVFTSFWLTLAAVLAITFGSSYGSFSVLIGVLAIGIEQYVEVITTWVLHPCERLLKRALGLPAGAGSH